MASLKNIMNTDDEHVDSSSGTRSVSLTSRPPSTHSHATTLKHPPPSSSHNNRSDIPVSSMASSLDDHTSSPKPDINMTSRRRSNASVESNDFSYQPGPSSHVPMRPFTGAATGEAHVKLTPITRKISKAKKGVPVHTCNQCPKTFSRAEHLRRHQLSHSAPDLFCPVENCNKTFHRKDLLDRHVQRQHTRAGTTSGSSNMVGPWSSVASTSAPHQAYHPPPTMNNSSDNYSIGPNNYVLHTLPTNESFVASYSEPRNVSDMSIISSIPEEAPPDLGWPESSMSSSAPTSTFSTPPDNTRRSQFSVPTTNGSWMTATPTYPTTANDITATLDSNTYPGSYSYTDTPPQAYPSVFGDMDLALPGYSEGPSFNTTNQIPIPTVRSMSPSLAVAQSETLVAVSSLPTSDGVFGLGSCSSGPSDGSLLSTPDLMPLSLPAATRDSIPTYLETYWEHVHPKNPIIHKHTYEDVPEEETEHVQVLQCAMAALATQYIPNADDRMKGAQLHAYAWQKSKVLKSGQYQYSKLLHSASIMLGFVVESHTHISLLPGSLHFIIGFSIITMNLLLALRPKVSRLGRSGLLQKLNDDCWLPAFSSTSTVHGIINDHTLPIPLTATTTKSWEAHDPQTWTRLRTRKDPKTISSINMRTLSVTDVASLPEFDTAILLVACSLFIPRRQNPANVGLIDGALNFESERMFMLRIFPDSAVASTYLALHYTPLYYLLSVSGQSWVFNKKVTDFNVFVEHQKLLGEWCKSSTAAIATVFAARALKIFLKLKASSDQGEERKGESNQQQAVHWTDISDYWGVYVCSLICWAFGIEDKQDKDNTKILPKAPKQWILTVADLEPSELQAQNHRNGAQKVVSLVKEALENDCLGGGNILFADAVNVLKQLERGVSARSCPAV
ncbi:C2H2 zinc finger transcription factor [Fusarium subglutinans]|uniref:C2H2 zinc finger transcription factor n=1 Tax=Gibberella subglutinans TaxID=42677 RepID=A0A8H5PV36_GIBSU|nr:C2H2 zinc finger transcription factor [Fusarium subglutinans]KAF5602977.1 C2H2 zinc finger transcription factor [Fusarium subglutinans]